MCFRVIAVISGHDISLLVADSLSYCIPFILIVSIFVDRALALKLTFVSVALWSVLRIFTIGVYREPAPPLIGFVLAPFLAVFYVLIARKVSDFVKRYLAGRTGEVGDGIPKSDNDKNSDH